MSVSSAAQCPNTVVSQERRSFQTRGCSTIDKLSGPLSDTIENGQQPLQEDEKPGSGGITRTEPTRSEHHSGPMHDPTLSQGARLQEGQPSRSSSRYGSDHDIERIMTEPGLFPPRNVEGAPLQEEGATVDVRDRDREDGDCKDKKEGEEQGGAHCQQGDPSQEQGTPRSGESSLPGIGGQGAHHYLSKVLQMLTRSGLASSSSPFDSSNAQAAAVNDTPRAPDASNKSRRAWMLRRRPNAPLSGISISTSTHSPSIVPSTSSLHHQTELGQENYKHGAISATLSNQDTLSESQTHQLPNEPAVQAFRSNNKTLNPSRQACTASNRPHYFNSKRYDSSGFLLEQETTRTWRGLFKSVRELSYPTSTTGSSTHSLSSSSSISSFEERPCPRNRHTKWKTRKSILSLSSKCEERRSSKSNMSQKLSIVIVGDGAVGKSALTLRFLRDQFHDEYDLTIEDSYCKHIEVDGQEYTLDINDTAGQNEYRGHGNDQFLRERDGFVCVYSITSTSSFEQLIGFRDRIWRAKESRYVPMIMVGNKRDLSDHGERQIPTEMGARLAEQSNSLFVEASAKTGSNVDELFMALVREIARTRRGKGISKRASASSMSAKAPSGSVNGDSRNVTLPATKRSERDRKPKKLKSYQCCTIM